MLGRDVVAALAAAGEPAVTAAGRATLDVRDLDAVRAAVAGHDVIVNCAAWTAVDDAQTHEAQAFEVNALGAANLARAGAETGAWMLHVSTDYVFAGDAVTPYVEDAAPAPRSAYGRTKAAGEWAVRAELPDRHWILRTAWLYGEHGPSFVRTMARLERGRETVDVVDDQRGQPTWSRDLAERIVAVASAGASTGMSAGASTGVSAGVSTGASTRASTGVPAGTYHATSSGAATWYDLAQAVFELVGADPGRVRPTTSCQFVRPAPRPAWSVLGHDRWSATGLPAMRGWRDALTEAMATPGVIDVVGA
jgi:dTDP-4-dehydrorhamnose reductase